MGRAFLLSLVTLLLLGATALLVWNVLGGPDVPSLTSLASLDPDALGTAVRLSVWALLGLLLFLLIARVIVSAALLFSLNYAPLAYLGHWLLLPVVRKTAGGITAGMMLSSQLIGGSGLAVASSARAVRSSPATAISAVTVQPRREAGSTTGAAAPEQSKHLQGSRHPRTSLRAAAGRQRAHRVLSANAPLLAGAVTYTVQPGDSLSGIAGRFYGDMGGYTRLFSLNQGRLQPDGGHLTSPWLIQPGWRLVLPLPSPTLSLDGHAELRYVVQKGDCLDAIAAGLLGGWRRYKDIMALNAGHIQADGSSLQDPNLLQPGWVLRLPAEGVLLPRKPAVRRMSSTHYQLVLQRQTQRRATHVKENHTVSPAVAPHPDAQAARHQGPAASPRLLPTPVDEHPIHRQAPHPRTVPASTTAQRPVRSTPRTRPTMRLPDGRLLPTGAMATFLGLLALLAWRRRRRAGVAAHPWLLVTPAVRSMVGTGIVPGMKGWLASVLSGRMRGDEADRIAPLLAGLHAVWAAHGWPAPHIRSIREGEHRLSVSLLIDPWMVGELAAGAASELAHQLGCTGSMVQPTRRGAIIDLIGVPAVLRGVAPATSDDQHRVAAAWGPDGVPHPAPFVVPVGAPREDQVLHVNLASLPSLLVVSGPLGDASHTVLSLLTHVLKQAQPGQVRVLVAGEPGGYLDVLAGLPHLAAPFADAGDPASLFALLEQAEAALIAAFAGRQQQTDQTSGGARDRVLLVLEEASVLIKHPALLARFDALCRASADHGVVVIAGTRDLTMLCSAEAQGVLGAFAGRLVSRLGSAEESQACLGEEGAEDLENREVLWTTGEGLPERLIALTLHRSEAHEIFAAVIAAAQATAPPLQILPVRDDEEEETPSAIVVDMDVDTAVDQAVTARADNTDGSSDAPHGEVSESPVVGEDGITPVLGDGAVGPVPVDPAETDPDSGAPSANPLPVDEEPVGPNSGVQEHVVAVVSLGSRIPEVEVVPPQGVPLALRLLGGLELAVHGRAVHAGQGGLQPSAQEFLAYLALQRGKPLRREEIQLAFWPETTPERGKANFHTRRYNVRDFLAAQPDLPDWRTLLGEQDSTYWLDASSVWVDALAFEDTLAHADAMDDTPERQEVLLAALGLYRGDLFASQAPPWAGEQAEYLRGRFLVTATKVCKWNARRGRWDEALTWAERLTREEPLGETYYRLLMRVQKDAGQMPAVERTYQRLRSQLHKEMGELTEPEERTQKLYASLIAGGEGSAGVAPTGAVR